MLTETSSQYSDSEIDNIEEKWAELIADPDYEVNENNVYQIRRKGTNENIKLTLNKNTGYYICTLNRKKWLHHRVIALQFIPNPDEKPEVDHINRIRNDNRIENLRWCSHYENMQNRGEISEYRGYAGKSFIFTEEIDKDCIKIEKYGTRELEGYYYDFNLDQFYKQTEDGKYRLLNVIHCKDGNEILNLYDKNHTRFKFSVNKFKSDNELNQ